MGQLPYFPPTVAGWEGSVAWLNTNTALARFGARQPAAGACSYATLPDKSPEDVAGETPGAGVASAPTPPSAGPGSRKGTISSLRYYSAHARAATAERPHRAPARAARIHARRPRRTGDVMNDETPRSASGARPTRGPRRPSAAPTARAPTAWSPDLEPVDAHADLGRGARRASPTACRARAGMDRRDFLRTGALGMASVYAATRIDWTRAFEAAVAEGASPGNQLVMIFLNGGNDGLNTVVPSASTRPTRPSARRSRASRGPRRTPRSARTVMPGTGGAHAWANVGVSGVGNNGDTRGFDTLWGDGSGGPGSDLALWPGGRLHAGQPLPLRQPRLLVRRRPAEDGDRLARALARPLRLARQPAPGGLARLEHLQADPDRQRAGERGAQPQRGRVPR